MQWLATLLALALCACATPAAPRLSVGTPAIVVASPEAGPESQVAAYVRIRNPGAADRLVGVSCACAAEAAVHNTFDRQMHTLPALDIAAEGDTEIRPGGPTHLMLMGLNAPLTAGESVAITLTFERAGPVVQQFEVIENSREAWAARTG